MSDSQFTGCFTQLPELPTAAHCCLYRHVASGLASPLCLQASLSGLLALTAGCNQQYLQWQIYPASGASAYVNHTVTGLCLYPGSKLTVFTSCPEAPHLSECLPICAARHLCRRWSMGMDKQCSIYDDENLRFLTMSHVLRR